MDHVFNFFVTAYHVFDYVEKTKAVEQSILDKFRADQDMRDCRDLCDKAKHLRLTKRSNPITDRWSGTLNGAPLNSVPLNGDGDWELWSGGRKVDIRSLARRVMQKWDAFFLLHGVNE